MKYVLWYLGVMLLLHVLTYWLFLAVMRLQEMRNSGHLAFTPHPTRFIIAYFTLFVGMLSDTLLNWCWLTIVGLQIPHEFLSTARMNDWYRAPHDGSILTEWRRGLASGYGDEFLNDADQSGQHIKG